MSLTDTARHWLWGCALATAASRSDVNVAMPHLRGKWSPTKAIFPTLELLFMKAFLCCLAAFGPPRLIRVFALRYGWEMERVPQVLQLAVVIDWGRSLSR